MIASINRFLKGIVTVLKYAGRWHYNFKTKHATGISSRAILIRVWKNPLQETVTARLQGRIASPILSIREGQTILITAHQTPIPLLLKVLEGVQEVAQGLALREMQAVTAEPVQVTEQTLVERVRRDQHQLAVPPVLQVIKSLTKHE